MTNKQPRPQPQLVTVKDLTTSIFWALWLYTISMVLLSFALWFLGGGCLLAAIGSR